MQEPKQISEPITPTELNVIESQEQFETSMMGRWQFKANEGAEDSSQLDWDVTTSTEQNF